MTLLDREDSVDSQEEEGHTLHRDGSVCIHTHFLPKNYFPNLMKHYRKGRCVILYHNSWNGYGWLNYWVHWSRVSSLELTWRYSFYVWLTCFKNYICVCPQISVALREWDIPYEELTSEDVIGTGRFGTVYKWVDTIASYIYF